MLVLCIMKRRNASASGFLIANEFVNYKIVFRVALGLLIIATFVTRTHSMGQSLWADEAWVANAILEPSIAESIYYHSWLQTSPPLFLILNRLVIRVLGLSNETLRFFTVVIGTASVVPMIYIACRLLRPTFALVAIFFFVFSPELVRYTHELKQYSSDVFASLILLGLGLGYINRPSRSLLYFWLATFFGLTFFSYQALIFIPGFFLIILVGFYKTACQINKKAATRKWLDPVAVVLCGLIAATVNYFIFIKPNKQAILDLFWTMGFFHGENVWGLLKFDTHEFLRLASLIFLTDLQSKPYVLQILICSVLLVGLGTLYARGLLYDEKLLNQALFLSMPILSIYGLNVVKFYPLGTIRLMLFLTPIIIILFVYGLESISYGLSTVISTAGQKDTFQNTVGVTSLILLIPLLWIHFGLKGASPLFRSEPVEDSERAVRYLSERVQPADVVYVHASMREQFKLYSRMMPPFSATIIWGNIGWPCCPRDVSFDRLGEIDSMLPPEMAKLEIPAKKSALWLLFSDRSGYWSKFGRQGPGIFEHWLTSNGCLRAELVPLRGARIDKYRCNRNLA